MEFHDDDDMFPEDGEDEDGDAGGLKTPSKCREAREQSLADGDGFATTGEVMRYGRTPLASQISERNTKLEFRAPTVVDSDDEDDSVRRSSSCMGPPSVMKYMPAVTSSAGLRASTVIASEGRGGGGSGGDEDDGGVYDAINECDDGIDPSARRLSANPAPRGSMQRWVLSRGHQQSTISQPRDNRDSHLISHGGEACKPDAQDTLEAGGRSRSIEEEHQQVDSEGLVVGFTPTATTAAIRFGVSGPPVLLSSASGGTAANTPLGSSAIPAQGNIARIGSKRADTGVTAPTLDKGNSIFSGTMSTAGAFFETVNLRVFQKASQNKPVIGLSTRSLAKPQDIGLSVKPSPEVSGAAGKGVTNLKESTHGNDKERLTAIAAAAAVDPQKLVRHPTTFYIWFFCALNVALMVYYLTWRFNTTFPANMGKLSGPYDNFKFWWWWLFFIVELWLSYAIALGHTMRLFPVKRAKATMDQLVAVDKGVAENSRIAVMIPTAGEKLDVVLKALLGAMSQRLWDSGLTAAQTYRVLVLDEKRRPDVYQLVCWVYAMARLIVREDVRNILMGEGLVRVTPRAFYEWCTQKGGFARRHLYNTKALNKAIMIVRRIDALIFLNEAAAAKPDVVFISENPEELGIELPAGHDEQQGREITVTRRDLVSAAGGVSKEDGPEKISPGYFNIFATCDVIPIMAYYSRVHSGCPRVSPKAGNMNAAIFPLDYPDQPPLVHDSTVVVVNDCRHQIEDEFLQRCVPYFFKLQENDKAGPGSPSTHTGATYKWSDVAFVQVPQRFKPTSALMQDNDPLGNESAVLFDIINPGKDGVGAVSSSGQGSLWRVEALKGMQPDGTYTTSGYDVSAVGHTQGFRAEMLIEDTHTSIDMFRLGWRSAYVSEENEVLAWCTHQPDNIKWRMKQVLRWHQGACAMLLTQSLLRNLFTGKFPTIWHRIYIIDQTTYFLQAFPGYALTMMPLIYAASGHPPFRAMIGDYFIRFVPVILTSMIPTTIASTWRNVDTVKLTRDEQVWLSTCYIQIYALLQTVWQTITCAGMENAWTVSAPIYPLYLAFMAQFAAVVLAAWRMYEDANFVPHFIAVFASAVLMLSSLWPMMALQVGWRSPPGYYVKLGVWACVGIIAVLISYVPGEPL